MPDKSNNFRYPDSRAFRKSEKEIFTGRELEIQKLSNLCSIEKIVVLYGNICCGKTSLINAGLLPHLEIFEKKNIIHFNFKNCQSEDECEIFKGIHKIINSEENSDSFLDKIIPSEKTLWYYLKKYSINVKKSNEFTIIIDDFDNFFTYKKAYQQKFKQELSTLLYTKVPQNFRNEFNKKYEENKNLFTEEEIEQLFEPLNIKLLIVINSENLSKLNTVRDFIPGVMQFYYELNPLELEKAYEAIEYPALFNGDDINFCSPQFEYDKELLEKIVHFIYFDGERNTDLFQLQVICQKAEQIAIEKKKRGEEDLIKLTIDDLGDLGLIFKEYYENLYKIINDNDTKNITRLLIEEGLILEDEKFRLSMYEGIILKNYNIDKSLLLKIVDYHILRFKTGHSGGNYYEISHDVFLPSIIESKVARREAERLEQDRIKEEKRKEEEKLKLKKQRRKISVIFLFLILILLLIGIIIINQLRINEKLAKENETAAKIESQAYSEQADILLEVTLNDLDSLEKETIYEKTDAIISKNDSIQDYENAALIAKIYCELYDKFNLDSSLRAEAYGNYGWYLFFLKDYDLALEKIERAYKFDSNILWIKENLAIAYFLKGNFTEGKKYYDMIKDSIFDEDNIKFKELFEKDLQKLYFFGIIPPDKDKIEELMEFKIE